jgi:hypothetical protein
VFAVSADARTAICPRCGKALPILAAKFSFTDEELLPRRKADADPTIPEPAKLARIQLHKVPPRDFGVPTGADKPAVAPPPPPPPSPPSSNAGRPPPLPPLPPKAMRIASAPAPPPGHPRQPNHDVAILPKARRFSNDGFRPQTGVDLPHRPTGAPIDLSLYSVEPQGIDAEQPTVGPHGHPTIPAAGARASPEPVIPVEFSPDGHVESLDDQAVEDNEWVVPGDSPRNEVALEREPPPQLGRGNDYVVEGDWQEPVPQDGDAVPADAWQEQPGPGEEGEGWGATAPPADGADGWPGPDAAEGWEASKNQPALAGSAAVARNGWHLLDEIPTAPEGLAAATLRPALPAIERSPAPADARREPLAAFGNDMDQTTVPRTSPSREEEDAAAPLNLPEDTGIKVFVPQAPIEEVQLGAEPAESAAAPHHQVAPNRPEAASGSGNELAPVSVRRSVVARGHGTALRDDAPRSLGSPVLLLVGGILALVTLLIGAVVLYKHCH